MSNNPSFRCRLFRSQTMVQPSTRGIDRRGCLWPRSRLGRFEDGSVPRRPHRCRGAPCLSSAPRPGCPRATPAALPLRCSPWHASLPAPAQSMTHAFPVILQSSAKLIWGWENGYSVDRKKKRECLLLLFRVYFTHPSTVTPPAPSPLPLTISLSLIALLLGPVAPLADPPICVRYAGLRCPFWRLRPLSPEGRPARACSQHGSLLPQGPELKKQDCSQASRKCWQLKRGAACSHQCFRHIGVQSQSISLC